MARPRPTRRRAPRRRTKSPNAETAHVMDEAIRHAVDLEALKLFLTDQLAVEFEREVVEKLVANLERRLERIRNRGHLSGVQAQKNVQELIATNNAIVAAGVRIVRDQLKRELGKVALKEAKAALAQIQSAYPVNVGLHAPSARLLKAAVEQNPVRGDYVGSWFKKLEEGTAARVQQQIRIGLAEGKSTKDITRAIKGSRALQYRDGIVQQQRREVETLVRTSVQNVVTDAREQTYAENSDIVTGVRLIAVLDSRTTFICISEDQNVYPIGSGPRPPLHFNCRTTTVPELISAEELGLKVNPVEGKRAALGAKGGEAVPSSLNYSQWFARQPADWQREVLGPGRFDLYKRGVPLVEMKSLSGRRLSIDEIKLVSGLN